MIATEYVGTELDGRYSFEWFTCHRHFIDIIMMFIQKQRQYVTALSVKIFKSKPIDLSLNFMSTLHRIPPCLLEFSKNPTAILSLLQHVQYMYQSTLSGWDKHISSEDAVTVLIFVTTTLCF